MQTHSKYWRKEAISLLRHGPTTQPGSPEEKNEMEAMRLLIDSGYARGSALLNGEDDVVGVVWSGATIEGLLFADEQQAWLAARSTGSRLAKAGWCCFGWAAGVASTVAAGWLRSIF